jgi:hypothetical protein
VPLTVHTGVVSEAKLTVRPEDAVALTVNGTLPYVLFCSALKVMVWLVCAAAGIAKKHTASANSAKRANATANRAMPRSEPAKDPSPSRLPESRYLVRSIAA